MQVHSDPEEGPEGSGCESRRDLWKLGARGSFPDLRKRGGVYNGL